MVEKRIYEFKNSKFKSLWSVPENHSGIHLQVYVGYDKGQ